MFIFFSVNIYIYMHYKYMVHISVKFEMFTV